MVVHEKNSSSNIFSLWFYSLVPLVSQRYPLLKRSRTISFELALFYAIPEYLLLGAGHRARQTQSLDLLYSFTSSLTPVWNSASRSKEVDSSTCRGSKKSKKR